VRRRGGVGRGRVPAPPEAGAQPGRVVRGRPGQPERNAAQRGAHYRPRGARARCRRAPGQHRDHHDRPGGPGRAGRGPQDAARRGGGRAGHTAAPGGTGGAAAALADVEVLGAGARHGAAPGRAAVPGLYRDAQAASAGGLARDPDRQRAGLPGAVRRAVHPSGGRPVRLLQGDRAAAADPVLHRAGAVAQHLPAGRLQPGATARRRSRRSPTATASPA